MTIQLTKTEKGMQVDNETNNKNKTSLERSYSILSLGIFSLGDIR